MENNFHTFTLSLEDWELVINSLHEAAADRMSRADNIGLDSTYGSLLYADGLKTRDVAQYFENFLPASND
jgi:hypothetical protein